jgi:hypothetical protein
MTGVTLTEETDLTDPTDTGPATAIPVPGQLVTVRNRPWIVTDLARSSVSTEDPTRAADATAPHLVSLVSVENEDDTRDEELRVVWELEQGGVVHDLG